MPDNIITSYWAEKMFPELTRLEIPQKYLAPLLDFYVPPVVHNVAHKAQDRPFVHIQEQFQPLFRNRSDDLDIGLESKHELRCPETRVDLFNGLDALFGYCPDDSCPNYAWRSFDPDELPQ